MSKAENAITTSAASRRDVLRAAPGALAITAIMTTESNAQQWSLEFLEYRRLRQRYAQACRAVEFPFGSPESDAADAFADQCGADSNAAADVLVNRHPRTWQDIVELAAVVRTELYCETTGEHHSYDDKLEDGLLRAIEVMAHGGAHV